MYGSYKEIQQVTSLSKNKTLSATAICWPFVKLYVKLYSTGIYQLALLCLIQQDKILPDQSRKGKKLSQSGISIIIQIFFC